MNLALVQIPVNIHAIHTLLKMHQQKLVNLFQVIIWASGQKKKEMYQEMARFTLPSPGPWPLQLLWRAPRKSVLPLI